MRVGWFRRHRTAIASGTVVAVAGASLLVYALSNPGYAVHHADLNDGGVWVANAIDYGAFARVDKPLGQMDIAIAMGPKTDPQQKGDDLDIVQDGNAVFGRNKSTQELKAFDTAQGGLKADAVAGVPSDAQVAIGGADPGVLAVLNATTGDLRAMHVDPDTASDAVSGVDAQTKPIFQAKSAASLAVSNAGTIFVATKSGNLVTVRPNLNGFDQPSSKPFGAATQDAPQVTAVGESAVVLDGSTVFLPNGKKVDLGNVSKATLQQPGPSAGNVVVAVATGLLSVNLGNGSITPTTLKTPGVTPAAPVVAEGCVYGAWYDSGPSRLTDCPGQPGTPWETALPDGSPEDPLVFRVNRGRVLLNDPRHGKVWNVDGPEPRKVDNWESVLPTYKGSDDDKNDDNTGNHVQPIKAVNDNLSARPGVTSVLHVLDNDTYPKGHVIAISNVTAPSDAQAKITVAQDEQTVALSVPTGARVPVTFSYTITDSGSSKPSTANVVVTPVADTVNDPPKCDQCASRQWQVGAGTVLDMPVLPDWRDPQNDPLALVSAKLDQAAAPGQAAPVVTSTGEILFTAPARPPAGGTVSMSYQVSDGRGGITTEQVRVKILSATDANGGARPTTYPDVAQATVGEPLTVFPLSNDLPGSDPTTDNPTLQLSDVSQRAGAAVEKDTVHGSFTFTASRAGTFMLTYSATYGAQSAVGTVRIDARAPGRAATQPVALPDTAVLFGSTPTTVDVLANDYDQGGGLLVVQDAAAASGSDLQVAVIGGHWLQIAIPNRPPKSVPEYVTYTVTNGTDQATGTVAVLEHDARDTDPIALPDTADVRAGDSVSIPVVDNDIDPAGAPLTLVPGSVDNLAGGGWAYTVGSTIRYIAPADTVKSTSATFDYTVTDGAKSSTGSVEVRIHPDNAATNQGPHPQVITARVVAGGTIKIPIPTSGVDPDGDSVTLVGQRDPGPKLGTITATTSSSITYAAFPIDYLGTDTIGYRVTDKYGRIGDSTIRIAVVMPGELQPPVPVDDRYEAQPGAQLSLDVVANDVVAAGDTVKVTLPESDSGATIDQANPRVLHVTAPPADGEPLQVRYGLVGGTGQSERLGQLTVLGRKNFDNPPVARDDNAKPVNRTASTVTVPVLANDADPEGDKIVVSRVWGNAKVDPGKQKVTVTLTTSPQVIPYEISDGKKTASALIFAPAVAKGAAYVKNDKYIPVPRNGNSATIDINDYVASPDGKTLRLGFPDNFTVAPSAGLKLVKKDGTHFVLTGLDGYVGPASITIQVTNGSSVAEKGASNDFITIPVQVGDPTPVLRCPVNHTTLLYQGGAPTTVDLAAICHLWVPPTMSMDKVRITTAWKQGASISGVNANLGSGDGQITFDPTRDAHAGQSGVIQVGVQGSTQVQTVAVRVLKVGPLTLDPINRTGHNNKQLKIDLKAVAHTVIRSPDIQAKSCSETSGEPAKCEVQGQYLLITPADTSKGAMQFSFTVTDVPSDASRTITGRATVNTIGRPAPVGSVTANANRSTGGEVRVSWTPPAFDGGAPIDYFLVKASPADVGPKKCTGSTCTVTGLTNGKDYTFAVTAWNTADQESATPVVSNSARPDKRPAVPTNVQVTPGDGVLTLAWSYTANGSSAVKNFIIQQQDITSAQTTTRTIGVASSYKLSGLSNTDDYRYRIAAVNDLGTGSFSNPGVPAHTAGKPAPMAAPSVPAQDLSEPTDSVYAHITWDPEPTPNGGPIDYYTVSRRVKGTSAWTVLAQCDKVDPSARQCDDKLTNNGTQYQYMVTATNSTVPAGHGQTSGAGAVATFDASSLPDTVTDLKAYASQSGFTSRTADPGPTGGTGPGYDGAIKVSFTVPAAHAKSISRMEYSLNGGAWSTLAGGPWTPGAEGTATINGLTNGDKYAVSVRAVNASGKTAHDSSATPDTYPYGPVPKPTAKAAADGGTVNYSADGTSNGRPITLFVNVDGEGFNDTGKTSWSTSRDKGYNKSFSLSVYSKDSAGNQSDTAGQSGTTPEVPPPTNVSCGATNNPQAVQCTWNNPDTKFVKSFECDWGAGGFGGCSSGDTHNYGDYGTSRTFQVRSVAGSEKSGAASTTATTGAVPKPTGISCDYASGNHKKVTCSWNAPASGLQYRIRWGDGNGYGGLQSGTSASNTYGSFDGSWTVTVQASDGKDHYSADATGTAKTGPDPNPAQLSVSMGAAHTASDCTKGCHYVVIGGSGLTANKAYDVTIHADPGDWSPVHHYSITTNGSGNFSYTSGSYYGAPGSTNGCGTVTASTPGAKDGSKYGNWKTGGSC